MIYWPTLILFASLPLYVIRWKYFGMFPTTLLELFIWIYALQWIWYYVTDADAPSVGTLVKKVQKQRGVVLLFVAATIGVVVSAQPIQAVGIVRAYMLEPLIIVGILLYYQHISGHEVRSAVIKGLAVAAVYVSIIGIMQSMFGLWQFGANQATRAHGLFNNGNALALFIGPVIWLILYEKSWSNIARFGLLTLVVTAFFFSDSTGGIIAMALSTVLVVIDTFIPMKRIRQWYVPIASMLTLLTAGILLFFAPYYSVETDNPWDRTWGTTQSRICLWEGTRALLQDHVLFGVGVSGFKESYAENYVTCDAEPLEYPHNFWMTVWAELGLVGVLGLLVILMQRGRRIAVGAQVALVYLLLHGVVDVPLFKNDLAVLFATLFVVDE